MIVLRFKRAPEIDDKLTVLAQSLAALNIPVVKKAPGFNGTIELLVNDEFDNNLRSAIVKVISLADELCYPSLIGYTMQYQYVNNFGKASTV